MRSMHGFYPGCHSSGFIVYLDLPSRQNTQRAGHVRLFFGLLASISHRKLSNSLFEFVLFNLLPMLLSGANIAFRRRANEVVRFLFAFMILFVL